MHLEGAWLGAFVFVGASIYTRDIPGVGSIGGVLEDQSGLVIQSKDTGRPVRFVPPDFALADITKISRWQRISPAEQGCQYAYNGYHH